ncbi:putative leucine-rich repeat receptor-like serine/threonine-protein kinase At3g14840 [Apium graveolens]|uniref:putative leucine-rich repeat receptor-like serine/threonine-protein kinase At3g14840 n=1 Tax=Apium graveolens TaxID=4045 RepID=UPI003D7AE3A3
MFSTGQAQRTKYSISAILVILTLFAALSSAATLLPHNEVKALQEFGKALGKRDWNFSADPCSGEWGWVTLNPLKGSENAVTCNCSFSNNTVCHVVSILAKAQNLSGRLPSTELLGLPFLQQIDFTRNYLNGSLPPEWGSSQLVNISLIGNRLTGSIPKQFGNITTLEQLVLEYNQLSGPIPPELGNLPAIKRILLSSNNFTGELPVTLAKLTTLKDFRTVDNLFTGKIPDFIQNWTNIEKLLIQGSNLRGPIPSGIALLTKLNDLRISDLNGKGGTFPPLDRMIKLKTLILRSCNIVGPLPEYLGAMEKLQILDLSFNKISGQIPKSFTGLSTADFMYLTGNLLSGPVPDWMLNGGSAIDLSYNNLTIGSTGASHCQQKNVNLFTSASKGNVSGIASCLNFVCPRDWYSFHINCGGQELSEGTTHYEADTLGGPSSFSRSGTNWASSSTGHFLDENNSKDVYTWKNTSRLYGNLSTLYTTARLSPISLTYYGFCLLNGNYTVLLQFAEIMFADDKTYSSLGRRIFDVYIQGKLVLKDFNIAAEAGGVRKEVVKRFTAVVTSSSLEIRFYWAGKGTTGIPTRGVYGPLISAISVNPDFIPPSGKGASISVGTVVGIVVAAVSAVILVLGILWWKCCLQRKNRTDLDLKSLDLRTGSFTLRQIRAATNNFDVANKIGEGGFGSVYKGLLLDGTLIAVKQLSSKSKQGNREFVNEIGMISALQHPHLVKLYGCCIEGNQLLLVYEYMENNSLARALFGPREFQLKLDWSTRHKICTGIAKGLAYLHEESRLKIVHRDIKATNVLLDKDLDPKISDFGLAKLDEAENSHISTRVAGTYGYMAPEYAMRGHLTDKADVYSFGIVALEIVSGRSNTSFRAKEEAFYLLDWANDLKEKGNLMELVDERLDSEYNKEEVMVMINVALLCADVMPSVRPPMSSVVSILEGRPINQEFSSDASELNNKTDSNAVKEPNPSIDDGRVQSMSIHDSWTASSTSTADLYPVDFESEYWKTRDRKNGEN